MRDHIVIRLRRQSYSKPNPERLAVMAAEAREIERTPKPRWSMQQHCRWMLAQVAMHDLVSLSSEYRELR